MTTMLVEPVAVMDTKTETRTQVGGGSVAHIVARRSGDATAQAYTLEARISGFPVEALCGYTFVPHKNPKSLPVCEACKNLFDAASAALYSTPNEEGTIPLV